jgi:hypothetical protein
VGIHTPRGRRGRPSGASGRRFSPAPFYLYLRVELHGVSEGVPEWRGIYSLKRVSLLQTYLDSLSALPMSPEELSPFLR